MTAFSPGQRLGNFEIVAFLGSGGMGEVYRARDTKLQRDVAFKVLPLSLSKHPDSLVRFRREAQVLASLNHSAIAAIYGVEEFDGKSALVLELAEGQTLADRLRRSAMPVAEAIRVAMQIAEAMEAAHEKGIVHRDLKPANIKINADGKIKVLDFGLAKIFNASRPDDAGPALASGATTAGMILGTAAYMSPEQACGKAIDKRTDVWAFGAVLFEMLTGRSAFGADTAQETLVRILQSEPDWKALPAAVPPDVLSLIRSCLNRDLNRRWRDMGDAVIQLARASTGEPPPKGALPSYQRRSVQCGRFWRFCFWPVLRLSLFDSRCFIPAKPQSFSSEFRHRIVFDSLETLVLRPCPLTELISLFSRTTKQSRQFSCVAWIPLKLNSSPAPSVLPICSGRPIASTLDSLPKASLRKPP